MNKFLSADQKVWKVGKEVVGYVHKLGSMSQVWFQGLVIFCLRTSHCHQIL
ncbi:unnamed protein product [Prunus brigantina]